MWLCILLLLFHLPVASDDNSVALNGTIGSYRFVLLSENTISCEATSVTNTGSSIFLLGSVELNLNDNTGGGKVYMSNIEYDSRNTIFRALGRDCKLEQVKIAVYTDNDTSGSPITPAAEVELYDAGTSGTPTEDHTLILGFYAQDDTNNTLATTVFDAHFQIYWKD